MLLLLSTVNVTTSAETIKVLVDESRCYNDELLELIFSEVGDVDWRYSFENEESFCGFSDMAEKIREVASVDIRKKGKLSYSTLRKYDVLIIASFGEAYSSSEADDILKFVENGGSLILLGDSNYPNNSVSRSFGVSFESETVNICDEAGKEKRISYIILPYIVYYTDRRPVFISIDDFTSHPITKGIDEIVLYEGIPITSYESGRVLVETSRDSWADETGIGVTGGGSKQADEDEGPFDVLLAMEIGKGRAVFFGGARSFWNGIVKDEEQNLTLIANAVEWAGEPGGPYKQYKTVVEQGEQTLSEAVSLYEGHKFSQAKTKFEEAIGVFEEANEIYPSGEANQGIEEANGYIPNCETGIEADGIFDSAQSLYNNREYEKAIEEYEKAKSLYEEIQYTERALECTQRVDESNNWIALRDEATSLFQKGEDALTTAPSTFSPAGYEEAKSIFEQAKSKWEEYDDPAQVSACDEKITLCNDEIARIKRTRMIVIVGVIGVIAVVIVVVIVVIRKRKPKVAVVEEVAPEVLPEEVVTEPEGDALEALKDRYAKGEITKEEYEKLKSVLEEE